MAKHKVSEVVMDELKGLRGLHGLHYDVFLRKLNDANHVTDWIDDGNTYDEDDSRFNDVYLYVVMGKEGLFEEKVTRFGFIEDSYLFRYSNHDSLYKTGSFTNKDVNMTEEEARALFRLSKGNSKKIITSDGVTIEDARWEGMPF